MAHHEATENLEMLFGREKPKIFSPEQLHTFTEDFKFHLGSGAFGDVYEGKCNGEKVAVKVLKEAAKNIKDQFIAEVSTLGKTHHRNLVKLYGFCFQPTMKALVYEFMEMGSLDKVLQGKQSIKWETLCNIVIGTAKGLSYLHDDCQPSIIHYDIKPSNIMLDSNYSPKIGDFGLAMLLKMDATHVTLTHVRGTPNYCAPEICSPCLWTVNYKCDVYSYGMMLFDIVSMGKNHHQWGENWFPRKVWDKYKKGKLEDIMADCIEEKDKDMAKRILMIALNCILESSQRPSMSDIVRFLEGTKDPPLPPNHNRFSSSDSSSSILVPNKREEPSPSQASSSRVVPNKREEPKIFSPEQLRTFTSDFSIHFGSGAFGDVYQGICNGDKVAVKVLKEEVLTDDNIKDQFIAEVGTLGKTHHRNLVKLYGFCFQPNMKALVYEFMEMGSLDKVLQGKQSIKWETLCNIAIGTAKGLSYLHEDCQPNIIHYDIKPSNILLDSNCSPKIGNFGLAKLLKMDVTHVSTMSYVRGTPYYCAPEIHIPYLWPVNYKCDVYSYGMMLLDIVTMGKYQYQQGEDWLPRLVWDKYEKGKLEDVMADCIEEKDKDMAKRILMIALNCMEFSASQRPSMSDVVRLLEGTKDPQLPPNRSRLLSSDSSPSQASSSIVVVEEKIINSHGEKEKEIKFKSLGPWGGTGGDKWDDGVFPGILQIEINRRRREICSIEIEYCRNDGVSVGWSDKHGEKRFLETDKIVFDYPDEYLMGITGFSRSHGSSSGVAVRSISFITNKKIHGPYGVNLIYKGDPFTSGKLGKVVGFHGRSGSWLNAIGVHMEE